MLRKKSFEPKALSQDEPFEGILGCLAPSEVSVVTYSVTDGMQERFYKVFCGYQIESDKFFHSVESKHIPLKHLDLCDSANSSQLAESVDYLDNSDDYGVMSESSAVLYMAAEETK